MVRIDGKAYRLMGMEPTEVPAMRQIGLEVLPTRTVYSFQADGVTLSLTFNTPVLARRFGLVEPAGDVSHLARPVAPTGARTRCRSTTTTRRSWWSTRPTQPVVWSRPKIAGFSVLRIGSEEQPVLQKKGDNLRIDWGYLYVAARRGRRRRW